MKILHALHQRAASLHRRIVLSEGSDPRVLQAAIKASSTGLADIALVGTESDIRAQLARSGNRSVGHIDIYDCATSALVEEFATRYYQLRKHKGITLHKAQDAVRNPHVFAAMLVRTGRADGTIGGAVATTAEVVRTALQVIGARSGDHLVSSFFLMLCCEDHHHKKGAFVFADCALVVDPDAAQMAQIAVDAAGSFVAITGDPARVAMLSFSTHGSAAHPSASKVAEASKIARARSNGLVIDGELQFDAAFVPQVAATKAPNSSLAGNANVFVFPGLESGNIAYKVAQRIGGMVAIGPVLQGLDRPANDLSRGCSVEDILHTIAITAIQSADMKQGQAGG